MPELKMKPTYKIFILDEDEFNGLHKYIPEVSEKDLKEGLGFANPKTRECYVKRTGVKELDDETIIHEAEELIAKHSSDEDEENIRWKRGRDIVRIIAPIVGTLLGGPVGAGLLGGVGGAAVGGALGGAGASAISQAATGQKVRAFPTILSGLGGALGGAGMSAGVEAAKTGGAGFLGQIKGGLLGTAPTATQAGTGGIFGTGGKILGIGAGTPTTGPSVSLIGDVAPGLPTQQAMKAGAIIPMAGSPWTPSLSAVSPQILGSTLGGAGGISTGAGPAGGTATQVTQAAPTATSWWGKAGEALKQPSTILGGASLLGSMAQPTPKFEMPADISGLREKLSTGAMTPLGEQAKTSLQELLSTKPEAFLKTRLADLESEYTRLQQQISQYWNNIDPNYMKRGDYQNDQSLLTERYLKQRDRVLAEGEMQLRGEQLTQIQTAFQVDQNTANAMLQIAGMDAELAAIQFGISVGTARQIQQSLADLGVGLITGGFQTGMKK